MENVHIETTMLQVVCQAEQNRILNDASIALLKARAYTNSGPEKSIDKTSKWLESSLKEGSEKLEKLLKDVHDMVTLDRYNEVENRVSEILYNT